MKEIVDLIVTNGMSVVIIGYFIFKDWKQTTQIVNNLNEVSKGIACLLERSDNNDR